MVSAMRSSRIRGFCLPRNPQCLSEVGLLGSPGSELVPGHPIRVTLGRTLGMNALPSWFVYILRCRDASLYTGIARDVAARIAVHEAGRGAKYTRGRGPFMLCAQRRCRSQGEALRLEYAIKQLSRSEKEQLTRPRCLAAFARALARAEPAEP
jgi:putative endonuclease